MLFLRKPAGFGFGVRTRLLLRSVSQSYQDPDYVKSSLKKEGRSLWGYLLDYIHWLKSICYFPLLVLKDIYPHRICLNEKHVDFFHFPGGAKANGRLLHFSQLVLSGMAIDWFSLSVLQWHQFFFLFQLLFFWGGCPTKKSVHAPKRVPFFFPGSLNNGGFGSGTRVSFTLAPVNRRSHRRSVGVW